MKIKKIAFKIVEVKPQVIPFIAYQPYDAFQMALYECGISF